MDDPKKYRLAELSRFLKSRRSLLQPEEAGVPKPGRRRVNGLRREEVAEAAGMSTAWYTRLEQGRDVRASVYTLDRIAHALRLDRAERTYLLEMARPDLDWKEQARGDSVPSAPLITLIEGLSLCPAYILNKYWQVKACNSAARLVFGDIDDEEKWGGNLIARLFQDLAMRSTFVDWPSVARSAVAQLRMSSAAMANDVILGRMIENLSVANEEFGLLWRHSGVAEAPVWRKTVYHPLTGPMNFTFASLRPSGEDSAFSLSLHTPADQETRDRLAKLMQRGRE
jgi:transcriptional regulator with XRE-family HTH domain